MSFKDLSIKKMYRTKKCNIIDEFYIPVLNESVEYKRAVGFFSSNALYEIAEGIYGLSRNSGHIKLIVSPRLSAEDVLAIKDGYDRREIIEKRIEKDFAQPESKRQEHHLNLLANLISDGYLDIKVAFMNEDELYHEKIGVARDSFGNKIAINGSMNETYNAFLKNFESFDVFDNWRNDETIERCQIIEESFDALWNNEDENINIIPFPKICLNKIEYYKQLDNSSLIELENDYKRKRNSQIPLFRTPKNVEFYDYQEEAVNNWMLNSSVGIFDMATGSGKTFTALYALSELSLQTDDNLAVVIVVPYQHLVEQWVEDINNFGVLPIVAYSAYDWRKQLKNAVKHYNMGIRNNFCVITTIATFATDDFQKSIKSLNNNFCFVADEAHNMGATNNATLLPENAKFRLGLSATIERYKDEEGTEKLYSYFGEICQSFSLKEAITRGFLTEYYYYPVLVNLTNEELTEFSKISDKISKLYAAQDSLDQENKDTLDLLLIKRARIVSGAINKIDKLFQVIAPYKDKSNILVYCGATKYDNSDISDDGEIRQIEYITKELYKRLGFKVRKFTSSENALERKEIKSLFEDKAIQVITAIKCLDEGVNIPAISTAFILASSTNPKEYIQRRGRVLRKAEGKKYSEIYDFITLPYSMEELIKNKELTNSDISLILKEFDRMEEFASSANNPMDSDNIIFEIKKICDLYKSNRGVDLWVQ